MTVCSAALNLGTSIPVIFGNQHGVPRITNSVADNPKSVIVILDIRWVSGTESNR
jgi:hypothetical protein